MQQTITTLVDDIDGKDAAETVTFAIDGTTYEIDLSDGNAAKLRSTVRHWADRGRTGGKATRVRKPLAAVGESRNALIRAWAASQGITVPARGRIPNDVQRQYDAAN